MLKVCSVDETFEIIKTNFSEYEIESEMVELRNAHGRVLFSDIMSKEDLPSFNRSQVDGYAVKASNTFGASDSLPAQLKVVGEVFMGKVPAFSISNGETAYVPTGGQIPEGADAMVMIEYCEDFDDGYIYVSKPSAPGNHIVFRGDDITKGAVAIQRGKTLRPQEIGAAAALGYDKLEVFIKVKVGIISTGDEVVDITSSSDNSTVRDINSYALFTGLEQYGAEAILFGIVKDDYSLIKAAVEKALMQCDVVLVSGGSSVGTRDVTDKVIQSLGDPGVLVHGIAVKPGKPTIIGKVKGKAVIGLPGHPVSAYMIFKIFVTKLLDTLIGFEKPHNYPSLAVMDCNYPSNAGREEFLPVKLAEKDGLLMASPIFGKSGLITTLTDANAYVHISRGSEGLAKGDKVEAITFF